MKSPTGTPSQYSSTRTIQCNAFALLILSQSIGSYAFTTPLPAITTVQSIQNNIPHHHNERLSHLATNPTRTRIRPLHVHAAPENEKMELPPLPQTGDPYKILNIKQSMHSRTTKAQIKRAYRQLAVRYHPDIRTNHASTEEERSRAHDDFAKINAAYEYLIGKSKDRPGSNGRRYNPNWNRQGTPWHEAEGNRSGGFGSAARAEGYATNYQSGAKSEDRRSKERQAQEWADFEEVEEMHNKWKTSPSSSVRTESSNARGPSESNGPGESWSDNFKRNNQSSSRHEHPSPPSSTSNAQDEWKNSVRSNAADTRRRKPDEWSDFKKSADRFHEQFKKQNTNTSPPQQDAHGTGKESRYWTNYEAKRQAFTKEPPANQAPQGSHTARASNVNGSPAPSNAPGPRMSTKFEPMEDITTEKDPWAEYFEKKREAESSKMEDEIASNAVDAPSHFESSDQSLDDDTPISVLNDLISFLEINLESEPLAEKTEEDLMVEALLENGDITEVKKALDDAKILVEELETMLQEIDRDKDLMSVIRKEDQEEWGKRRIEIETRRTIVGEYLELAYLRQMKLRRKFEELKIIRRERVDRAWHGTYGQPNVRSDEYVNGRSTRKPTQHSPPTSNSPRKPSSAHSTTIKNSNLHSVTFEDIAPNDDLFAASGFDSVESSPGIGASMTILDELISYLEGDVTFKMGEQHRIKEDIALEALLIRGDEKSLKNLLSDAKLLVNKLESMMKKMDLDYELLSIFSDGEAADSGKRRREVESNRAIVREYLDWAHARQKKLRDSCEELQITQKRGSKPGTSSGPSPGNITKNSDELRSSSSDDIAWLKKESFGNDGINKSSNRRMTQHEVRNQQEATQNMTSHPTSKKIKLNWKDDNTIGKVF